MIVHKSDVLHTQTIQKYKTTADWAARLNLLASTCDLKKKITIKIGNNFFFFLILLIFNIYNLLSN